MGNLLLDASSPGSVWNASGDPSTGSFTPPAKSLLVVWLRYNTGTGNTPTDPTVTDSLGVHLTYTLVAHNRNPEVSTAVDGALAVWTAPVLTSAAMTVTAHETDAATGAAILVQVWTDDSGAIPGTGAVVENASASAITSVAQGFTATATGSRGLIALSDFNAAGVPAAGSGCTVTGGDAADQGATLAYCCALRSTADGVAGATTTMNLTIASTTDARWIALEVTPAPAPLLGSTVASWWPGAGPNPVMRFRPDPFDSTLPSITEAAVTIDPALATWVAVAVVPTPQPVLLTLTPANAVTWSAVPLTPVPQPVALTLTPATATWAAQPVVATPVVALTPAAATWTAVAVSPAPQPVALTLTPAVATWAAVAVTPTPGQTARTLTPATATWTAVTVAPVPGVTAVTLTPATLAWTAVAVIPTPGPTARTITPATATWVAVVVTPVPQPVSRTLTPSTASWQAVPVSPVPGSVAITLTPAPASWTAVPVAPVVLGGVSLVPATLTWSAVPVTLTPGQVSRTLTPATATWTAVPVSALPTVALTPALATWSARPLALAPGSVALTLVPATLSWTARPLGVPVALQLTPAGMVWVAVPLGIPGAVTERLPADVIAYLTQHFSVTPELLLAYLGDGRLVVDITGGGILYLNIPNTPTDPAAATVTYQDPDSIRTELTEEA